MRNKNLVLGAIIVVVLGGVGTAAAIKHNKTVTPVATPTATATAVTQSNLVPITVVDGKTALAALEAQQTVEVKHYSFGDMVTSINGLAATDTQGWTFYVNGTAASVGAGDYTPKAGDTLEFRYQAF